MNIQKQAFSFIELLITVSIIVLLTIIGLSVNTSYTIKANNSRITADLDTAYNALVGHIQVEGNLPIPGGNKNYFSQTGNYTHSWTQTGTYGVYGSLTEHTLSKKYIDSVPRDHNTNNYFAYGITRPDVATEVANQFELSAIIQNGNSYNSIVKGNYTGNGGIYNLIRSYNGPDYVYNNSEALFPYNPESIELTARLQNTSGNISINGDISNIDRNLISGDIINIEQGGRAEMYLSDGSISILGGTDATTNTQITVTNLSRPKENNLLSQVSLFLASGNIWTKATDLNDDGSEFQISTVDGTASVRGTIFGVINDGASTKVAVVQGNVEISTQTSSHNNTIEVAEGEPAKIFQLNKYNSYDLEESTLPYQPDITTTAITPVADNIISDPVGINNPDGTAGGSGTQPVDSDIQGNLDLNLSVEKKVCAPMHIDGYNIEEPSDNYDNFRYITKTIDTSHDGIRKKYQQKFLCDTANGKWGKHPDYPETAYDPICMDDNKSIFNSFCVEKVEGMSLYAKADYDVAGDIDLINHEGDTFTKDDKYIILPSCDNTGNCNPYHTAYQGSESIDMLNSWAKFTNGIKGLFIDNSTDDNGTGKDYLKYSGLDLNGDFVIEMSVKKSDLERTDTTYTLFNLYTDNNLYLRYFINNNKHYSISNGVPIYKTINSLNCSTNFCQIFLIKNNNQCTIRVGNQEILSNFSCDSSMKQLFLGSNNQNTNQWDGVINYIKLYKY